MENNIFLIILTFLYMVIIVVVVFFSSLSVLCVLIRPGPGEGGGGRQQVDRSKLRAFFTIMIILGVLLFRFVGFSLVAVEVWSEQQLFVETCAMQASITWFCLPSSLVLPLLFLQRAGKLVRCQTNNE